MTIIRNVSAQNLNVVVNRRRYLINGVCNTTYGYNISVNKTYTINYER